MLPRIGIGWTLHPRRRRGRRRIYIAANRVAAEAGADTRVRVEAQDEVRDWDVGILTVVLNKVKTASNRLNREMVCAKEETK